MKASRDLCREKSAMLDQSRHALKNKKLSALADLQRQLSTPNSLSDKRDMEKSSRDQLSDQLNAAQCSATAQTRSSTITQRSSKVSNPILPRHYAARRARRCYSMIWKRRRRNMRRTTTSVRWKIYVHSSQEQTCLRKGVWRIHVLSLGSSREVEE